MPRRNMAEQIGSKKAGRNDHAHYFSATPLDP
jgi:hypothetical protein